MLVPRLRQVAAGEIDPPSTSMVATAAVRELDGYEGVDDLLDVLSDVDRMV